MMGEDGIMGLISQRQSLEDRIEAHLAKVPADDELKHNYVDRSDREKVRRRALIAAVLDAVFEHGFSEVDAGGVDVEVGTKPDLWSDLADARRDFQHDCEHLDNGENARGCLVPLAKDGIVPVSTITARRKIMIVWLAVIKLWDKADDKHLFENRECVRNVAAASTDEKASSYKTNLSNMNNGKRFSEKETDFYRDLVTSTVASSRAPGEKRSAFQLLFPAAMALSAGRSPKTLSAETLKG